MRTPLVATLLGCLALTLAAQEPPSSTATQREAMGKLSFLVGHWSGPATITRGPGEPLHLTQTEAVEYKVDGLVLLIEGASRNAEGKVVFTALATVSFDENSHTYRFRAYHDGHYLDTEMTVPTSGFAWSYAMGPVQVVNTMHLTPKREWAETTDITMGSNPPRRTVDMLLQHQP